jgi:hypothetical protein
VSRWGRASRGDDQDRAVRVPDHSGRDGYPSARARCRCAPAPALGLRGSSFPEVLRRATAYLESGVDSIYPIVLSETEALRSFMSEIRGPVNRDAMARVEDQLASFQG